MKKWTLIMTCLFWAATNAQIYVNHAATGNNDGTTWTNAYTNLQTAINAAASGSTLKVAQGTYIPDRDTSGNFNPTNEREKAFYVKNKVITIEGAYNAAGGGRDYQIYPTILSGDIGVTNDSADNCYVVLWMDGQVGGYYKLEGLEFTGGNSSDYFAGGMWRGAITITTGCTISNCKLYKNKSRRGGAVSGSTNFILDNCKFYNNEATEQGGAVYCEGPLYARSCIFHHNTAPYGGGVKIAYSYGNIATIDNSIFYENSANHGGAIDNYSTTLKINNCNLWNNLARGSVSHALSYASSTVFIYNSVLYNTRYPSSRLFPTPQELSPFTGQLYGAYNVTSDINFAQRLGSKNIAPLFRDTNTYDFRLTHCSNLLDIGNKDSITHTSDFAYGARVSGRQIDIGAYEYAKPMIIPISSLLLINRNSNEVTIQWLDSALNWAVIPNTVNKFGFTPVYNGTYAVEVTELGCKDTSNTIVVDNLTTNKSIKIELTNIVYPNPFLNLLNISNPMALPVKIISSQGKEMFSAMVNNKNIVLENTSWPSGVYFIIMGDKVQRLVKE